MLGGAAVFMFAVLALCLWPLAIRGVEGRTEGEERGNTAASFVARQMNQAIKTGYRQLDRLLLTCRDIRF